MYKKEWQLEVLNCYVEFSLMFKTIYNSAESNL